MEDATKKTKGRAAEKNEGERELDEFQLRNISILTHLLVHDAVSDEIVDMLRLSELDYFSLMDKYKLLEGEINIDQKTNLLKFKTDYLTNIVKTASRIYHGMKARKYHITFIRFDIDDFSVVNNTYGHDTGDQVLIKIAAMLRDNSRPTDYVIRFGGEEFDVILPATDIHGAEIFLNKIYDKMKRFTIRHENHRIKVTLSAGVSHMLYNFSGECFINEHQTEKQFKEMQTKADDALYEAKFSGKNRYCVYQPSRKSVYAKIRRDYQKSKK
jgi:diguanylate cyclase (GGDEF)-like protein